MDTRSYTHDFSNKKRKKKTNGQNQLNTQINERQQTHLIGHEMLIEWMECFWFWMLIKFSLATKYSGDSRKQQTWLKTFNIKPCL